MEKHSISCNSYPPKHLCCENIDAARATGNFQYSRKLELWSTLIISCWTHHHIMCYSAISHVGRENKPMVSMVQHFAPPCSVAAPLLGVVILISRPQNASKWFGSLWTLDIHWYHWDLVVVDEPDVLKTTVTLFFWGDVWYMILTSWHLACLTPRNVNFKKDSIVQVRQNPSKDVIFRMTLILGLKKRSPQPMSNTVRTKLVREQWTEYTITSNLWSYDCSMM